MELMILSLYVANFFVSFPVECAAQIDLNAPIDLQPLSASPKSTVVLVNNKKEARLPFLDPRKTINNGRDALARRERPRISPNPSSFRVRNTQGQKTKNVRDNGEFKPKFEEEKHFPKLDSRRDDLQQRSGYVDEHSVHDRRFRPLTSSDFNIPRTRLSEKAREKVIGAYPRRKGAPYYGDSQYDGNDGKFHNRHRDSSRFVPHNKKADRRKPPILIFEEVPVYVEVPRDEDRAKPPHDYNGGSALAENEDPPLERRPDRFFNQGSYHSSPHVEYHPPSYVKDTIYTTEIKETPAQNKDAFHYYDEGVPDNLSYHPHEGGASVTVHETVNESQVKKTHLPAEVIEHVVLDDYSPSVPSTHYDNIPDQYAGHFALTPSNYGDPDGQFSDSFPVSGSSHLDHHHRIRAAEALAIGVLQRQAVAGFALNQRLQQIAAIMRLQQAASQAAGLGGPLIGHPSPYKNGNFFKSQGTDPSTDTSVEFSDKNPVSPGQEEPEKYAARDISDTIFNQLKKYGVVEKEGSARPDKLKDLANRLQLIRSFFSEEPPSFDLHHSTLLDKDASSAGHASSSDKAKFVEFLLALPEAEFKGLMNMSKQQFLATLLTNNTSDPHPQNTGTFSTPPPLSHVFDSIPSAHLQLADSSTPLPLAFNPPSSPYNTHFSPQFSIPSSVFKSPNSGQETLAKPGSDPNLPTSPPSSHDLTYEGHGAPRPPGLQTHNVQPPTASTIYRHQTTSITPPSIHRVSTNAGSSGPVVNHHGTPNFSSSLGDALSSDATVSSYSSPRRPLPQSHYGGFRPNLASFSSILRRIADEANSGSFSSRQSEHKQEGTSSTPFTIPSTVISPPSPDSFAFTHQIKIINQFPSNDEVKRFLAPTTKPLPSDNEHSSISLKPQVVQSGPQDFKDQQPFYTTVSPVLFHSTISHPRHSTVKPLFRNDGGISVTTATNIERLIEDNSVKDSRNPPHVINGLQDDLRSKSALDHLQQQNDKGFHVIGLNARPETEQIDDGHVLEKRKGNLTFVQVTDASSENGLIPVVPFDIQYQEIPAAVVSDKIVSANFEELQDSIKRRSLNKTVNFLEKNDEADNVPYYSASETDILSQNTDDASVFQKIDPDASIISGSDNDNVSYLSDINGSILSNDIIETTTATVDSLDLPLKTTTETIFRASNNSSPSISPSSPPHSSFGRISPQPQRVDASSAPSFGLNVGVGGLPGVGEAEGPGSVEALIRQLSLHLQQPPPCAGSPPAQRSFCLLDEDYPQTEAEQVSKQFKGELSEMRSTLSQVELPSFSLEEAALQIPTIDPNVECADIERTVTLGWARDMLGSWLVVLHTNKLQQAFSVKTCSQSARRKGCRPLLLPRPLIAFHPQDVEPKPVIASFSVPIACVFSQ